MCLLDIIMNIPNGAIQRPVFAVTSCNWDYYFIAPEDHWDKHRSFIRRIPSEIILYDKY